MLFYNPSTDNVKSPRGPHRDFRPSIIFSTDKETGRPVYYICASSEAEEQELLSLLRSMAQKELRKA